MATVVKRRLKQNFSSFDLLWLLHQRRVLVVTICTSIKSTNILRFMHLLHNYTL